MHKIGILHPGAMGTSVAASAVNSGHEVYWASQDRSDQTRSRAETNGLIEITTFAQLCTTCEIIVSICPPHAAEDVARKAIEYGFSGLYLDANAISPSRASRIGALMDNAGINFVDGGIIGGPAWTPNEAWLYLSGNDAETIAACFSNGPLATKILSNEIGKASALKMCYAAYSKGTTALLAAILATAESFGVRQSLYDQWEMDTPGFSGQVDQRVARAASKAWRFEGEMRAIAATFEEAGLPREFHSAAAEIYHRIAKLKGQETAVTVEQIIGGIAAKVQ